jgi:IS30 family transposase
MRSYHNLSREDREKIAVLWAAGHQQSEIARALGRSPSTISRELRRNARPSGQIFACSSNGAYMLRRWGHSHR